MRWRKRHKEELPEELILPDELSPETAEGAMPEDWREDEAVIEMAAESNEITVPKKKRGVRAGQFFSGGILSQERFTRRLPVVVYIVFLMLLYIANGFRMQQKHARLDEINGELKRLKTISVTTAATRMTLTRQSEIERLLKERNIPLFISPTPPKVIDRPEKQTY